MTVPKRYQITGAGSNEIVASVEHGVARGALAPGSPLPTVRALAQRLRISHGTVAAAYRQLAARGIVLGDGRRGTLVRDEPALARAWRDVPDALGLRDCSSGNPDAALLPSLRNGLASVEPTSRLYGCDPSDPQLSTLAAQSFRADRVDPSALVVVHGALDGIERALSANLRVGDRVVLEDPAYPAHVNLLGALGLRAEPITMDARGIEPERLERALERGARAIICSPRAQNPTGTAFHAQRARELRSILSRYDGVLVLEDDHAMLVSGADYHTLAGATQRWFVVRSLSKAFGPDLRIGVAAGDAATVARLRGRQQLGVGWVSHITQTIARVLWNDAAVASAIERAAQTYTTRRLALVDALEDVGIDSPSSSGLNVWIPLADESAALALVRERGFVAAAGERFRIKTPSAIRVTIASLPAAEATALAQAIVDSQRSRTQVRTT